MANQTPREPHFFAVFTPKTGGSTVTIAVNKSMF